MTKNTLRYHHEKSCPGKPIDTQALPVKRRKPKEETIPYNNKGLLSQEEKQPTYRDKLNERILNKKRIVWQISTSNSINQNKNI
jgi:hypothetical protein